MTIAIICLVFTFILGWIFIGGERRYQRMKNLALEIKGDMLSESSRRENAEYQAQHYRRLYEEVTTVQIDEGEDYVRASLGLASDDIEEQRFIKQVLLDHEQDGDSCRKCGVTNYYDHLAERLSTALNGRSD